jgi:hypothetical protein
MGPVVGVTVGVGVGEPLGAVSAANTVKWDVVPVTVPAPGLTLDPPSTGCHVTVTGLKKNTPVGVDPLKVSVTWAG